MSAEVEYIDLDRFVRIAEHVTGMSRKALRNLPRIGLAESALHSPAAGFGDHEEYPAFETKVAVLLHHLAKNHPLPDGNKRCAYVTAKTFALINGRSWASGTIDDDERFVRGVAAGDIDLPEIEAWVRERIGPV